MTISIRGVLSYLKKFIFDIYRDKQTYRNLIFSLTLFPIGILAFIYIVTGFFISFGLLVVLVGIPLNYYFLRSLRKCVLLIALISNKTTGHPDEVVSEFEIPEENLLQNYLFALKQWSTWIYLIYLLGIFWISIGLFILTFSFLTLALVLRIEPIYELIFDQRIDGGDFSISNILPEFL
ncbi:MAG: sensor domain-containing protein [Candidatus Kariarchaeaceae archaeon]